jgi:S-adenosylmethionine decarboxylase
MEQQHQQQRQRQIQQHAEYQQRMEMLMNSGHRGNKIISGNQDPVPERVIAEEEEEPFRYEGAEKTLEVHFKAYKFDDGNNATLRSLSRPIWDEILDHACCRILSKSSTDSLDAYVLSESSLFVYDWRLYLKTCGKTTLLKCLPPLFKAAEELLGARAEWLRFSHKNFAFPLDQKYPHGSFEQETQFCLEYCSSTLSSAHVLGDILSDHWNVLYIDRREENSNLRCNTPSPSSATSLFSVAPLLTTSSTSSIDILTCRTGFSTPPLPGEDIIYSDDDTNNDRIKENIVNIMMYGMDREVANHFYPLQNETPEQAAGRATKQSGITLLLLEHRGSIIFDSYMFTPCGYSLNALIGGEYYATIHVTPEPEFSYASFETNLPTRSYETLLRNVLNVFRPRKCTVALFSDCKHKECLTLSNNNDNGAVYRRISHGSARIQNVFFAEMSSFSRFTHRDPSAAGEV